MTNENKPIDETLDSAEAIDAELNALDATAEEGVEEHAEINSEAAPDEVADLRAKLELAQAEADKFRDQYVRAEAEMANLRRRVERDVENAHKFGQEKLSKELLAVADNLERAIMSTEGDSVDVNAIREGVEMTLRGLQDTFGKFNIEAIHPEGEPFDPQLHQAMSMVENPDVEPNTVIAVMQKGYSLHGRLIRPAMVMVSKGGQATPTIDEQA